MNRPINTSLSSFNAPKAVPTFAPQLNTNIPKPPCPIDVSVSGAHLNVGQTFPNVVNSGPHHVSANAYGKIPLASGVQPGLGGGVQYANDHGHGARVNVDHVFKQGTTVSADANLRLMQSRDSSANVDLSAGASRHFGRHGASPVSGHGMLRFEKRF